jgi:hypothetical protein
MISNDLAYQSQALQQRYRSGARWFFWIAGLTIVTSLMALSGGGYAFFLSLGVTQFIDGVAKGLANEMGDGVRVAGLVFDLLVAGAFALIGWFALKRHLWAFVVGLALFILDALVLLVFQVWISFAFHALVTYWIFRGYQAARALSALEREQQVAQPPAPPNFNEQSSPANTAGTVLNLAGE